jgi:hypothetical protein
VRRIVGPAILALVAPSILEALVRLVQEALPATSGEALLAAILVALALGLVLPGGPGPRRTLFWAAALVAATILARRSLVDFFEHYPQNANLARGLALAWPLGIVAFLAGSALRGLAGAAIGAALVAAAAGTALAGPLVAFGGRGLALLAGAVGLAMAGSAWPDDDERASPSVWDFLPWAAGISGGLAGAAFAYRLGDLDVPGPVATGTVASAVLALGAGALLGLGLAPARPRRAIAVLAILLGAAAAFHWAMLTRASAADIASASLRFDPRTGFGVALGVAYTFAPIASSWGVLAGALVVLLGRSRTSASPALAAIALGAALGIAAARPPKPDPPAPADVARATALPRELLPRRPAREVVLASALDRERIVRAGGASDLVVALPPADRRLLSFAAQRALEAALPPGGLFCQWVRLADFDAVASGGGRLRELGFRLDGLWLSGFGEADPWIALVRSGDPQFPTFDASTAASPAATFLGSPEPEPLFGRDAIGLSLERTKAEWGTFVSRARREATVAETLEAIAERRETPRVLVKRGANLDALAAASNALLRAEVARLRAERELAARYVPAEASARRDVQWAALAEAWHALPGDAEIERLVCAAAASLEPDDRRLRLKRFVEATGVRSGPIVDALVSTGKR